MWCLGTQFSGRLDSAVLQLDIDDLKGLFQPTGLYDTTVSQAITFKIDYHTVWLQDEDILLVNTELGLTPRWILGNRARFPSCIEYPNPQVTSRKDCLLCLFIAMETLVSTAFFVLRTLLRTHLRCSQHESLCRFVTPRQSYVTFLLNDVGNQEEIRHQAAHALLQSLVIRPLSKSQIKGSKLQESCHLRYDKSSTSFLNLFLSLSHLTFS